MPDTPARTRTRSWSGLDLATAAILAGSIAMPLVLMVDFLIPPQSAGAFPPGSLSAQVFCLILLTLMATPTLCCAAAWTARFRQGRPPKFGWLHMAILTSALWTAWVFAVLRHL